MAFRPSVLLFVGAAAWIGAGCAPRSRGPVIARVGSDAITRSEFQDRLAEVAPEYRNYVLTPAGRRQFLDILIRERLMLAAAKAAGIPKRKDYRDEIEKLRREQALRLREFRDYLLIKLWRDELEVSGALRATDAEVRALYEAHPYEFQLRHILVSTPEEGEALLKKLRRGANFSALAKTNSLDQDTAQAGGRLRPLLLGEVLPELQDAASRLRTGLVSGLIRSKFGYHILRKDGQRRVPFQAVRERLRKLLEKEKLDARLSSLQSRYNVEVTDAQFK